MRLFLCYPLTKILRGGILELSRVADLLGFQSGASCRAGMTNCNFQGYEEGALKRAAEWRIKKPKEHL